MTRGARATGARACAIALGLAAAACEDPGVHVFSAQLYDTTGQCVAPSSTALDVIGGAATGDNCAPACLVESSQVYVSTVCPPYPGGYSVEAADAATDASDPCTAALAAFAAGTACGAGDDGGSESGGSEGGGADGGSPEDAATDMGAGDAPTKAGLDGSVGD
mgnify:CR=1 FL=1